MKSFLLTIAAIFTFFTVHSQIRVEPPTQTSKFKPVYIGLSAGLLGESYFGQNQGLEQLESRIRDRSYERTDISGLESSDRIVTNIGLNLNFHMIFRNETVYTGIYRETELGVGIVGGREVFIDYFGETKNSSRNVMFCDLQNELSVFSSYRIGYSFQNIAKFYSGIGGSLGSSLVSDFWVIETMSSINSNGDNSNSSTEEFYSTKSSSYMRAYVPVGAELVAFDQFHIGMETRLGFGWQQMIDGKGLGGLAYSTLLSAGWSF